MKQFDFFSDPDAPELFAQLDYALKEGVFIQDKAHQSSWFHFLEKHEDPLKDYYQEFYQVFLDHGGESSEKYYFLNFGSGSRGNIDAEHRYFMPNEYVIVAFMLYKIVFIDGYLELHSVRQLQRLIRLEYEDLKPGLYRTLAKAKRTNPTRMNDDALDKIISDALREFSKIGWITLDDDTFDTWPAFQRIHKIYADYINGLEEWLKTNTPL